MKTRYSRPSKPVNKCWAALAIAGVVAIPAAHAQTSLPAITVTGAGLEPNARLPLDNTTLTGSRLGLTARETAATINIVDRDTIEASGARDTAETLKSVPGIVAHQFRSASGSVSMRGFSSIYGATVTQLFNGLDVGYGSATNPIDSWLLERVEVLGGASSFLYGQGAVGGAANYVSKVATRQPLQHDTLLRAGSFGTYQTAYDVNGEIGGKGSGHFARVAISHQGTSGYVERTDGRSLVLSASWLADLTPQLTHTLAYEYQTKDQQNYWGTPLLNPTTDAQIDPATRFKNYNSADGAYEQTVHWLRSILEYRLSDKTTLTNTFYHYDAERDWRNVEGYQFNATNTLVQRSKVYIQKHGQSILGNRIEALHKTQLLGKPTTWSFGFDISRNNQTRYPYSAAGIFSTVNPYGFTPELISQIAGVTPATNPDQDNRTWTQALYAENHTKLDEAWSILSGLRVEHIKIDAVNHRAINAANPLYFQSHFNPITGRLGAMYQFAPKANVYATYSTSADAPSGGGLSTINYGSIKDWDLTTGRQFEVGSKFDFLDGKGNATIAAYKIVRKNLAMPDPANPTVSIPVGQQSSRGIELQAGLKLSPTWSLRGDLALVDARYDTFVQTVAGVGVSRAGNTPISVPDRIANVHLGWDFAPAWTMAADVRNVSAQWGNVENTQRFPGYTLLGASLSWKVDKNSTLVLRGRNLTDKLYIEQGDSIQARLGEPRNFDLSLRSTF